MRPTGSTRATIAPRRSARGPASCGPFLLVLACWVFFGACAPTVQVKTAADPTVDLSRYRSFAMMLPNKPVPSDNTKVDPFVLQRLRQLVYLGLRDRGYVPAPRSEADLLIAVEASQDVRVDVYPTRSLMMDPWYGYGPSMWTTDVSRTREGIVVIDWVDRQKRAVVWRGTGVRDWEPQVDETKLRELVDAILERAPAVGVRSADPSAENNPVRK